MCIVRSRTKATELVSYRTNIGCPIMGCNAERVGLGDNKECCVMGTNTESFILVTNTEYIYFSLP